MVAGSILSFSGGFRPGGGWEELLLEALDGEVEYAAEVNALNTSGRDAADQFRGYDLATVRPTIQYRLHLRGIPGHQDIGEQPQGIGNRLHLIVPFGLVAGNPTDIDGALQCIDGLPTVEHPQQFPPKRVIDPIVGQEDRTQQPTQLNACCIDWIAQGGRSKAG